MIIYILQENKYFTFRLPNVVEGNFVLSDYDDNGFKRNLVNIDAINSKWIIKSNDNAKIFENVNSLTFIDAIELKEQNFYMLSTAYNQNVFLYVSSGNDTTFCVKKFNTIDSKSFLTFGKDNSCDVILRSDILSSKVFEIKKIDNDFVFNSLDTNALVYINGIRYTNKILNSFDFIFINGFKILLCNDLLFINNPNNNVYIKCDKLLDIYPEYAIGDIDSTTKSFADFYDSNDYFNKSPVFRRKFKKIKVVITSPEEKKKSDDNSIIMSIVPSALMSITTLISAYFSVRSYSSGNGDKENMITMVVMCVVMLFISLVWPFVEKFVDSLKCFIFNISRNFKYYKYLGSKKKMLLEARNNQKVVLHFNNLSIDECQDVIFKKTAYLFSVNYDQPNFLNVTLGSGKVKMDCEFDYVKPDFIQEKDKLLDEIDKLITNFKYIDNAPYSFSLSNNISFIFGKNNYDNYLCSILLQLVTYHDYYNLKIVLFTSKGSVLSLAKNLNHCWNNDRSMRFYATNIQDAETLSSYLIRIFNSRTESEEGKTEAKLPFYLILCDDIVKYKNLTIINKLLHSKDKKSGFGFVCFAEKITDVPDGCSFFVDYQKNKSTLFQSEMDEDNIVTFVPEFITPKIEYQKCLSLIANTPIKNNAETNGNLPDKLGFLEMYGVGRVEQLNSIKRWNDAQIVNTLAAPIGIDVNGNILSLDLHEKKHGPHGLVAGMTGSGKSEFIITYILSLCVNYSPDEVQFVLIDYKGGGLAGAFENRKTGIKLPHLVGTITNLDKSSMNRTLVSIKSELQRRQRVFNEVKEQLNTGTIDIYKYQKLYREGTIKNPMSHLFIICDEFAELKAQQPDFMDELVSAARIGRSLGIHLILATQKPSGVVDDQIWSNSKFKVCCKVQTADDSKEMLRKDDAAYIKESGRFYLQVGYDEIYVKGQSAYSGTLYKPSDTVVSNSNSDDSSIEFVDNLGNIILSSKSDSEVLNSNTDLGDELGNVLKYLIDCAKSIGFENKQLWLDNVPENIYLYDLYKKYPAPNKKFIISPLIGEYDDPMNQKQGSVHLNVTEFGNTWISGIYGSGKTTLLSTFIYSTCVNYSSFEVNFYIVDLLAENLKMYNSFPQVGDFISSSEPSKLKKLFSYLNQEVSKRKVYFSDKGSTFLNDAKKGESKYPNIIVVINGMDVFTDQYDDLFNEVFIPLARDCNRFGIYFMISSTSSLSVMVENSFPQKIAMRYLDTSEYNLLFTKANGIIPSINPGRGLIELDNVYEFQTCLIFDDINFDNNIKYIENQLNSSLPKSKSLPVMPRVVSYDSVKNEIVSLNNLPIGIDLVSNCTTLYDMSRFVNLIVYNGQKTCASFVSGISEVINTLDNTKVIILDSNGVDNEIDEIKVFTSNFKKLCVGLKKNIIEKKSTDENSEKVIFIISGYTAINNHLLKLKNENEDEEIVTIDDLIVSAIGAVNFKFIVLVDKETQSIDTKSWSDYIDSGYGILLGTDKDDQELISFGDSYDDVKVNRDVGVVIEDYKIKYIKYVRNRSKI